MGKGPGWVSGWPIGVYGYQPGQPFHQVFGLDPALLKESLLVGESGLPTLLDILSHEAGDSQGGILALARHSIAALLNAAYFGQPEYAIAEQTVVKIFQAVYTSPTESYVVESAGGAVLTISQLIEFYQNSYGD